MMHYDIIILGFGPAGAVTAINLQRLGFRVALMGELRRHAAYEGLAPRTIEGLRRAGLETAQKLAGVEAPRTSNWNGASAAANSEYLVDRLCLDLALLEDCRAANIPVIRGRIGGVERLGTGLSTTTSAGETISGDFLVEARGRRAPRRGNIALRGPAALSITQKFTNVQVTPPQTYMSSYRDGWTWLAFLGNGEAVLQIVISPDRPNLAGKAGLEKLFTAEMAKNPEILARLGPQAKPIGPVMARESSAILSRDLVDNRSLRVGDAAFAIDPLSGHGNFEAIGGAMAAAAVINSLLNKPEDRELAQKFYEDRATSAFMRHARVGRDFYRMEKRWPNAPFWRERQDWPDDQPSHEVATSPEPCIKSMAVIENGFIVERSVIITADQPRGTRIVDGVPVADLLLALQKNTPPDSLANQFKVSSAQIDRALGWLGHHGMLPGQESRRSAP